MRLSFLSAVLAVGAVVSQPVQAYLGANYAWNASILAGYQILSENTMEYMKGGSSSKKSTSKKSSTSKSSSTTTSKKSSGTSSTPVKKGTTTFKKTSSTKGLDTLVSAYPANQRSTVKAQYQKLYNAFPQVARNIGMPVNDVASGLSALIGASYMAYNNQTFNDGYLKTVANQLRSALVESGALANMSDAEKQNIYDQMVMISMALVSAKAEVDSQPNAKTEAQMREAGKQVLEGLFKVSANRVKITSGGLIIN